MDNETITMTRPLEGVRVVDLTTYLAAPCAGRYLAYLGADVIKVEAPNGDPFRSQGNLFGLPIEEDNNPLFAKANDGKRFLTLNLKSEKEQQIFRDLVRTADVFITNMRAPALVKLHADYDTLHELNPRLVYGRVSGYGTKGALADKAGFDPTSYFARGGHMLDFVKPGSAPNNMMLGAGDCNTGMALAGGVLAALAAARLSGEGRQVDVSLLHTAIWMANMNYIVSQYNENYFSEQAYRTKDDVYMYVQPTSEQQKEALLDLIGIRQEEYDDHLEAVSKLEKIYATKTYDEWVTLLKETGICVERLRHIDEVCGDEQARLNGFIEPYGRGNDAWIPTPPVTYQGVHKAYSSGVQLGRDTAEILAELGYSVDCTPEVS